jgi:hypothetical protein
MNLALVFRKKKRVDGGRNKGFYQNYFITLIELAKKMGTSYLFL